MEEKSKWIACINLLVVIRGGSRTNAGCFYFVVFSVSGHSATVPPPMETHDEDDEDEENVDEEEDWSEDNVSLVDLPEVEVGQDDPHQREGRINHRVVAQGLKIIGKSLAKVWLKGAQLKVCQVIKATTSFG